LRIEVNYLKFILISTNKNGYKTMKHIIFFSCLLMLAGTTTTNASDQMAESSWINEAVKTSTESGNYLILATFRDTRLVDHFIDRMSPQLDKPIKVTTLPLEERTIYRVMIGPFDKKLTRIQNQYADLGLSGIWWFSANAGELMHFETNSMVAKVKEESTMPVKTMPVKTMPVKLVHAVEPVVIEPTVVKPVVARKAASKPMSVEYRLKYCATKASARERKELCSDRQIKVKVTKYLKLLAMTDRDYFSYCTRAPGSERPLYCTNRFSDVKASHSASLQASNLNVRTR
jgi:hypothetical protein